MHLESLNTRVWYGILHKSGSQILDSKQLTIFLSKSLIK